MQTESGHGQPVFYDESRRRWTWVVRTVLSAIVVLAFALAVFMVSIMALPLLPHNKLPRVHPPKDNLITNPIVNDKRVARRQFILHLAKNRLSNQIAKDRALRDAARLKSARLNDASHYKPSVSPVVAGFYVNWEETSRASLRLHVDDITHFIPEWLHLDRSKRAFTDVRNDEDKQAIEPFVRNHKLPIVPILSNYVPVKPNSDDGQWDGQLVHDALSNSANRAALIANLTDYILQARWQGINIDFEELAPNDRGYLTQFMRELGAAFHSHGLLATQDVQIDSDAFDIAELAKASDFIMPMLYDQHSPGDEAGAGSIAGIDWTRNHLKKLFALAPPNRVVLSFGSYAYDWTKGDKDASTLSYQGAIIQAKESQDPDDPNVARVAIDKATLNPHYHYNDDDGEHSVWMLDATTVANQWMVAKPYNPRGLALWYLGSEDPTVWSIIGRSHLEEDPGTLVDAGVLNIVSYGRDSEVDFEGEGELLDVVAEPTNGFRTIVRDPKSGFVTSETYTKYPSSYVVRRYGYKPKSICITFDDGPDPTWTPKVLDILKREGVKATFFIVGSQAEQHPDLIKRMWEEGHEIGNHTYTHPNMALVGKERTLLEVTTTQRIIEAITGHTTTLFRPPYAIDVEPRTGSELRPIIAASKWGFISVGEQIDPQDWNLNLVGPNGERGAQRIVDEAWRDRILGDVLLLHDAGGDRSATLEALPILIDKFKAAGYKFVSIADLQGVTREQMFPAVSGSEEMLVGVDKWVFEGTYYLQTLLITAFTLSVILGVSRQVLMATGALIQQRRETLRERLPIPASASKIPVSVIIAAFNEEKVISRTVAAVLGSNYANLQVIIVDDGSKDNTSAIVTRDFSHDPRVVCLRKDNGGKASALNMGLEKATGEVIVALDADTLFAPDTIGRLTRHFVDPKVGAVAGNVRVGNTNNILTRWQALEYITSQNFDRRAYDLLNCITVVPGAVGAWRRSAIVDAGGYTSETLAEDTDLTWKIRRLGWRIMNDSTALAYTEAPESLSSLQRQRFRWAYGTLQNLFKHRNAMFRHGAFGWVALPSLWLYQIIFPAISPIMDITVVWALVEGNTQRVLWYYLLMIGVEFLGAALAIRMDRGNVRLLPWLFLQRFLYRQLMYFVILKSMASAVRGGAVGWNKLERKGTARLDGAKKGES